MTQSLRGRLIVAATFWITLAMIAASLAQSAIFRQHVTAQFFDELEVHLDELQRLAEIAPNGSVHFQRPLSDPRYEVSLSGFYWELQSDGRTIARSTSLEGPALKLPNSDPADINPHTHTIAGPTGNLIVLERAILVGDGDHSTRYIIGTDQRHLDAVISEFNASLAMSSAAFGLSLVALSALLIAFALKPLEGLRQALFAVRSGSAARLEGRFPSEVVPLVDDLNALLRSTSDLIQRARTQAGNMAHGLKTPLAILTDEAYRLQREDQGHASETILDQCRKMQTHIDYQIARARAAATRATPGIVASAHKSAEEVSTALARLYAQKSLQFENHVPTELLFACDPADLNEMLANLVDNACKHAHATVRLSVSADTSALIVEDDGPGLPPEALEAVLNVGEMWDSRQPGSGLGLAIVRDLATLYGGDITLSASVLGGLKATLKLPKPTGAQV